MYRAAITIGIILLWTLSVGVFFAVEESWGKPPVRRGDLASMKAYLVRTLNEATSEKKLGCIAVALVQNGKIAFERGVGLADPETQTPTHPDRTLFLLSSVSKAVTAWGVLRLVQEGKLNLDEPVLPRLTRWRFPGSEAFGRQVTARQLLSHTAGFVDGYGHGGLLFSEKLQTIEESLNLPNDANIGEPHPAVVVNKPGTVMVYSSAGYAVLQLLIEERTGKAFQDYMQEAVLHPLGMTKSSYDVDAIVAEGRRGALAANYDLSLKTQPHRHYTNLAGVSLRATAHDLARLVAAYSTQNPVLNGTSVRHMVTPQAGTDSTWALGHTVYARTDDGGYIIGHGGGGFPASGAEFRVNPATGNGIVILGTGTRNLITDLGDVWTYWETGKTRFDPRKVIHKRLPHLVVVIVLGSAVIVFWRKSRTLRKKLPEKTAQ